MRTFKELQKQMREAHDCDKSHNKIMLFYIDKFGFHHCGYCRKVIRYPKAVLEELATFKEFKAWMEEIT